MAKIFGMALLLSLLLCCNMQREEAKPQQGEEPTFNVHMYLDSLALADKEQNLDNCYKDSIDYGKSCDHWQTICYKCLNADCSKKRLLYVEVAD